MKFNPSIIALKDFENINEVRFKLARYSTANKAPSINVGESPTFPDNSVAFTTYIFASNIGSQGGVMLGYFLCLAPSLDCKC
jgi:hypothetical protein